MYNLLLLSVSLLSANRLCTNALAFIPFDPSLLHGPALPVDKAPKPKSDLYLTALQKGVKFGDQEPAQVFETIRDHCSGTTCEADSWTINTRYSDHGNGLTDGKITLQIVDATFQNNSIGDLVEVLKIFATEASENKEATYVIGDSCQYAKFDRPCSNGEDRKIASWSSSGLFDLRVQDEDGSVKDHLRVSVDFKSGADEFMEAFCGAAAGVGSAVFSTIAGPVGKVGETALSLAGIGCE